MKVKMMFPYSRRSVNGQGIDNEPLFFALCVDNIEETAMLERCQRTMR